MPNVKITRRPLLAVLAVAGAVAGVSAMSTDNLGFHKAAAGNSSVSTSAKASSSSSSSSSATGGQTGECNSQATASAEVTTIVNGKKKTVRQEQADRGDGCSANAKAQAVIDGSQPDDPTAE